MLFTRLRAGFLSLRQLPSHDLVRFPPGKFGLFRICGRTIEPQILHVVFFVCACLTAVTHSVGRVDTVSPVRTLLAFTTSWLVTEQSNTTVMTLGCVEIIVVGSR